MGKVRAFDTGATRDADDEKFDPEGFIDPRVLEVHAQEPPSVGRYTARE